MKLFPPILRLLISGAVMSATAVFADDAGPLGVNVSLKGRRPFPADNPWNTDISREPVDPNSDALVASIGLTKSLHPDFGTVYQGAPSGIPYIVVAGRQEKVPVTFQYADESDAGPYPIPANAPIEGGPHGQGDRHVIVVERDTWKLYETFSTFPLNGGQQWKAGSGAVFDLYSNKLRPAGWTSADAAGLPIFPGLVRYDEVMEQKAILHALRFTVVKSRRACVPPATHFASSRTDANLPPMGMGENCGWKANVGRSTKFLSSQCASSSRPCNATACSSPTTAPTGSSAARPTHAGTTMNCTRCNGSRGRILKSSK